MSMRHSKAERNVWCWAGTAPPQKAPELSAGALVQPQACAEGARRQGGQGCLPGQQRNDSRMRAAGGWQVADHGCAPARPATRAAVAQAWPATPSSLACTVWGSLSGSRLLNSARCAGLGAVSPAWVLQGEREQRAPHAAPLTVSRDVLRCLGTPTSPARPGGPPQDVCAQAAGRAGHLCRGCPPAVHDEMEEMMR